jgi:signal transduction histidine kinase
LQGTYGEVSEEVKNVLQKIEKNIQTEIDLVNNLLDLRKIEEGKMEYEFSNFNLTEVIKDICELYRVKAQEKNIELRCNLDKDIFLKADKEKIAQVINNLVDNAIKYTDQGYVEINLQEFENKVLVNVKDTGRGIKKENLEKIFEAFARGEEVKKEILGTGLGLYIVKNIVEAHKGKIWAESEGLGKGSTFYLELPKSVES